MFSLINILNCLPPLLALYVFSNLKHLRTRLIILTSGTQDKISLWKLANRESAFAPWTAKYTFLSFPKMLTTLTTAMWGGGGGGFEKEGTGVKWASHYY